MLKSSDVSLMEIIQRELAKEFFQAGKKGGGPYSLS